MLKGLACLSCISAIAGCADELLEMTTCRLVAQVLKFCFMTRSMTAASG